MHIYSTFTSTRANVLADETPYTYEMEKTFRTYEQGDSEELGDYAIESRWWRTARAAQALWRYEQERKRTIRYCTARVLLRRIGLMENNSSSSRYLNSHTMTGPLYPTECRLRERGRGIDTRNSQACSR